MTTQIIQFIPRAGTYRKDKAAYDFRIEASKIWDSLLPHAKSGGPIINHDEYACSEINPQEPA